MTGEELARVLLDDSVSEWTRWVACGANSAKTPNLHVKWFLASNGEESFQVSVRGCVDSSGTTLAEALGRLVCELEHHISEAQLALAKVSKSGTT
jgi:hypothetical protein